ncbi:MAG: hypothetical protein NTZ98_22075 [Acidobacteria bacterium]|jgi:hypothetical protein|nr:hypothetical protein [Acidobacteriota bacterium]
MPGPKRKRAAGAGAPAKHRAAAEEETPVDARDLIRKALLLARQKVAKGEIKLSASDLIRLLETADRWERHKGVLIEARWVKPGSESQG